MHVAIGALLILGLVSGAQCQDCGEAGQACCEGGFCSDVNQSCTAGKCQALQPGQGVCKGKGELGQPCCGVICTGQNIICSSGTCVDKTAAVVMDQSGGPPAGQKDGACIGADLMCDESDDVVLVCQDGVCVEETTTGVLDQSVRPPQPWIDVPSRTIARSSTWE